MKVKRNALCPCGSGVKFKKCCGGNTLLETSDNAEKVNSTLQRDCGDCTSCCQGWLTTNALGHDIFLDNPCPHCNGDGCSIHEKRPNDPCRIFFCAWAVTGSALPQWMQPSQSGVIVLNNRMNWKNMPVDILVSAGNDPGARMIEWFQQHCVSQNKAFVYQQHGEWFGYGPEKFQLDLAAKVARGEALWDGSLLS